MKCKEAAVNILAAKETVDAVTVEAQATKLAAQEASDSTTTESLKQRPEDDKHFFF